MAYGDFNDLAKRTVSGKALRKKAFKIASNPKYDRYKKGLATMVYKFFDKKSALIAGSSIKNEIKQNQQLADYTNQFIEYLKKRKVYSPFKDNIWGTDLVDMQLISKFYKEIRFLLCVSDIYSKYAWAIPLKDKEGVTIVNAFQKILDDSKRKPNEIWIDKGSEFYNRLMKSWLEKNDIEMYSTHNEGKSVVAERFIRFLKTKI